MSKALPKHHIPTPLLAAYSVGETNEAESLIVATHASMCPRCHKQLDTLEAAGGAELDDAADSGNAVFAPKLKAAVMAELDKLPPVQRTPEPINDLYPAALASYVASSARWQSALPGIRRLRLDCKWNDRAVELLELQPGVKIPKHRHRGAEYLLVLAGGMQFSEGPVRRGDVVVASSATVHGAVVDTVDACVCLVAAENRIYPVNWIMRHVSRLVGF